MPTFEMKAIVQRTVTDNISLTVEAKDVIEAYGVAEEALKSFPEPHGEDGVSYMYIDERMNGEASVMDLREVSEAPVV